MEEYLKEAREWLGAMHPETNQEYTLASIANSLYVIARVIADLDEVECLYPPKKDVV